MLVRLVASLALISGSFAALAALSACGSSSSAAPVASAQRAYNGTAGVGDMLTLTVDPDARTIAYRNLTNGLTGTATYAINVDGSWAITDSAHGHLLRGFEIPNYALIMEVDHAGAGADQLSVVTAIQSQAITIPGLANADYNYMQFRTNSGGMEVGSVHTDASSNIYAQHYWPYGAMNQSSDTYSDPSEAPMPGTSLTEDPSHRFLSLDEGGGDTSYIFRTTGGFLAVDTPNGSLVCLRQQASAAYDVVHSGGYKGFFYHKDGASTGMGNIEAGTPSLSENRIVFSAGATVGSGHLVIYASDGITPLASTDLTDMTTAGHVGSGKLVNACPGLFAGVITAGTVTTQMFVTFVDDAALITSYRTDSTTPGTYDYFNGVALRDPSAGG